METEKKIETVECPEEEQAKPEKETTEVEDESKQKVSPYYWVNPPKIKGIHSMVTMSEDISELSVYWAGETLFKSHIYYALGAALYEGNPMIVWIDYPYDLVKDRSVKRETKRVYFGTKIKSRPYYMWESCGDYLGLSPAVQELKFNSDETLKKYGLYLKKDRFDFTEEWDQDLKYLELDITEVVKEPTKTRLMKWLNVSQETDEDTKHRLSEELKRRVEKKNESGVKSIKAE